VVRETGIVGARVVLDVGQIVRDKLFQSLGLLVRQERGPPSHIGHLGFPLHSHGRPTRSVIP
jgi:hypothetical protein